MVKVIFGSLVGGLLLAWLMISPFSMFSSNHATLQAQQALEDASSAADANMSETSTPSYENSMRAARLRNFMRAQSDSQYYSSSSSDTYSERMLARAKQDEMDRMFQKAQQSQSGQNQGSWNPPPQVPYTPSPDISGSASSN